MGALPTTLPSFGIPTFPLTAETLRIILPLSLTMAMVGLIETLLTAQLVDVRTETTSDKSRECSSQGVGNIVTGFFGGMAGCAMIGQTMINVTAGGRGRLSTFVAGFFLLTLILVLQHLLFIVPMAARVAVMIVVSIRTFDWSSFRTLRTFPKGDTAIMLATVFGTLATRNLSVGVIIGVVLSAISFARKIAKQTKVTSELSADGTHRSYRFHGQLFFVSTQDFISSFELNEAVVRVTLDLTHAHIWDSSAVGAIDTIALGFMRRGVNVDVIGMNEASATLVDRIGIYQKADASQQLETH